jgi:predicted  nucleic acid-binding Zn-ribbon protein
MTTAAELFALQETDLAIDNAVANLTEAEAQLGETGELVAARERVGQCRARVGEMQERQKSLDWDAEEARGKTAEIEKKLYGGTVKNPKELEDFEADLKSLRGQLRKREDALLDVMLEVDDAQTALKEAEKTLAGTEELWNTEQASLGDTRAMLKDELATLEAKRSRQLDGVDQVALSLYEALRERRQGMAVAVVERGLCQGCRISLPMSVLQKARAGLGLVQCVSCERILLVN